MYLTNAVRNTGAMGLTATLLQELLFAALNVPVFSEIQRLTLMDSAGVVGQRIQYSPLMATWPFNVLGRKQDWDEDVVAVRCQFPFFYFGWSSLHFVIRKVELTNHPCCCLVLCRPHCQSHSEL